MVQLVVDLAAQGAGVGKAQDGAGGSKFRGDLKGGKLDAPRAGYPRAPEATAWRSRLILDHASRHAATREGGEPGSQRGSRHAPSRRRCPLLVVFSAEALPSARGLLRY